MENIETISYIELDAMCTTHTYRSVIVTLETVENIFKFRIDRIDESVDIMNPLFRLYITRWIKKRYAKYLKTVNGIILNIVRIKIEEEE